MIRQQLHNFLKENRCGKYNYTGLFNSFTGHSKRKITIEPAFLAPLAPAPAYYSDATMPELARARPNRP